MIGFTRIVIDHFKRFVFANNLLQFKSTYFVGV